MNRKKANQAKGRIASNKVRLEKEANRVKDIYHCATCEKDFGEDEVHYVPEKYGTAVECKVCFTELQFMRPTEH